jgi:hypothetical protein
MIIIIITVTMVSHIMYDTNTLKGGLGHRGILGFGNIAQPTEVHCSHKQNSV